MLPWSVILKPFNTSTFPEGVPRRATHQTSNKSLSHPYFCSSVYFCSLLRPLLGRVQLGPLRFGFDLLQSRLCIDIALAKVLMRLPMRKLVIATTILNLHKTTKPSLAHSTDELHTCLHFA